MTSFFFKKYLVCSEFPTIASFSEESSRGLDRFTADEGEEPCPMKEVDGGEEEDDDDDDESTDEEGPLSSLGERVLSFCIL